MAPVAAATPTADEISDELERIRIDQQRRDERKEQLARLERAERYSAMFDACLDHRYKDGCIEHLAESLYVEYGIDIDKEARLGNDNPLAEKGATRELELMASGITYGHMHTVNVQFLKEVGSDPSKFWNYEPTYLTALKRAHPETYEEALNDYRAEARDIDKWNTFMNKYFEWINPLPE